MPLQFDPQVEVSPFALFRALKEGRPVLLVDLRPEPGEITFTGAVPWPGPEWVPPEGSEVVLFDGDGSLALEAARRLQAEGHTQVRALFGGLELYGFSLDPAVVGEERFLAGSGD